MCQVSDSSSGFSGEALRDKACRSEAELGSEDTGSVPAAGIAGRDKGTAAAWPCAWRQSPQLENNSQLKLRSLSGLFPGLGHSPVDAQAGECVSSTDRGKNSGT